MTEQQYLIATQRAIDELARRCTEALAPAEYVQNIHDIGAAILALLADEQATDADHREGSYIAFDRPIKWADVFAEDRVP